MFPINLLCLHFWNCLSSIPNFLFVSLRTTPRIKMAPTQVSYCEKMTKSSLAKSFQSYFSFYQWFATLRSSSMLLQTVLCTSKVSLACRIFSQICSFTLRGAGWVINILCLTSPPSLPNSALPTKLLSGVQTKLDVLVVLQLRIGYLQYGGALS